MSDLPETAKPSASQQPPLIKERSKFVSVLLAWSVLVFAVVLALSIAANLVIIFFQPEIYESSVILKIEREHPSVSTFEFPESEGYDPYFHRTQFEIIESQKILYPVIEKLGLRDRWRENGHRLSTEVTYRKLRVHLSVGRYRETDLIQVSVRDSRAAEAAEIADGIAKAFQADRLEVKRQQIARSLSMLQKEQENHALRVEAARRKDEQLRLQETDKQLNVISSNMPFRSAASELQIEEKLDEAIRSRIQQATIEFQEPTSPVEIVDQTVPASAPVMPNFVVGLTRGVLIGLPLGLLVSLLTAFGLYRKWSS